MRYWTIVCLFAVAFHAVAPETLQGLEKRLDQLGKKMDTMMRQMMLQQTYVEERSRMDGRSGIKQVRVETTGTKSYHSNSLAGYNKPGGILSRATQDRNMHLVSAQVVLNGVEFRTHSTWVKLRQPHKTSKVLHATENIALPDVPPSVRSKKTVDEQVAEMQEYFKAWKASNFKLRDYRPYFKPVMCYLEGTWVKNDGRVRGIQDRIRMSAYSGTTTEWPSWLPTTIQEITNNTIPQYAQWNYRHICHPIKRQLDMNRFIPVDDLATRMSRGYTMEKYLNSYYARYMLNPVDRSKHYGDRFTNYVLLDDIMAEIPGKDNYNANLTDTSFDLPAYGFKNGAPILNSANYHRWYKVKRRGAMGLSTRHRAYADDAVFMAQTTQEKVAPMTLETCRRVGRKRVCSKYTQRWSYAIPLFVTYLTPLSKWNPYDLKLYPFEDVTGYKKVVIADGRTGGKTKQKAYNGVSGYNAFFMTPSQFFHNSACYRKSVLDKKGVIRDVCPSGQNMIFYNVGGTGNIRQTYPIFPVNGEGSPVWKELSALEDLVMDQKKFLNMYRTKP